MTKRHVVYILAVLLAVSTTASAQTADALDGRVERMEAAKPDAHTLALPASRKKMARRVSDEYDGVSHRSPGTVSRYQP